MSKLFDKLDETFNRVEKAARMLGKHDEPFMSKNLRTTLIDQLVQDTLDGQAPAVLIQDVLRNGCVGFNYFTDLVLCGILRDDIVQRGIEDDDRICPAATEDIIEALKMFELHLLD